MRVELLTPRVEAKPGASCQVELEVYNTTEVIDSVTSRLIEHAFGSDQQPPTLSLFPESGGNLTVSFRVPDEFPAGSHTVPIEIASTFQHDDVVIAQLELEVTPVVSATLGLTPSDITGGRKAKFAVDITNDGNVPLDLTLTGNDLERVLRFQFDPLFVHVEPGERVSASGIATGKRPFFGSPISRSMTILAWGSNVDMATAGRFTQKPRIPKGLITILLLGGVIAVWAAVFVIGAKLVTAKDSVKKTIPESILLANADQASIDKGKKALVAGVAGSITGTVTDENKSPVPRITVEAHHTDKDGKDVIIGSAASDADGVWELASVGAGEYTLKFAAPGFQPVWYPGATAQAGAQAVQVRALEATKDIKVTAHGNPGTITGAVIAGERQEVSASINVFTVVNDLIGDLVNEDKPIDTALDGTFSIDGLATPGMYELHIILNGFDDQIVRVELGGGEKQVINTVNMAAGAGSLAGSVIGPGGPLGGVTVTLSGGGQAMEVSTPTDGAVGTWMFEGLPTPGTYIVSFALEGFGTQTIAVQLEAGQPRSGVIIEMFEGTGQIAGTVLRKDGKGLGGVTVTVTGGAAPLSTLSLTSGDIGGYVLNGLASPGHYTLTFSLEGHSSVTIGVTLDSGEPLDLPATTLLPSTSSISGVVRGGAATLPGATVEVTDGLTVRGTVTADDPPGGYRFDSLPAGRYTLTISADGYESYTVLVELEGRGDEEPVNATLDPVSSP